MILVVIRYKDKHAQYENIYVFYVVPQASIFVAIIREKLHYGMNYHIYVSCFFYNTLNGMSCKNHNIRINFLLHIGNK